MTLATHCHCAKPLTSLIVTPGSDPESRSVLFKAELIGNIYIIQPSDYIILKLLAIANDKERLLKDELDISEFFKTYKRFGISDAFEKIDTKRIYTFAEKFGQTGLIKKYITPEGSSI